MVQASARTVMLIMATNSVMVAADGAPDSQSRQPSDASGADHRLNQQVATPAKIPAAIGH